MKEGWEYKTLGEVCEILDSRRKPITKKERVWYNPILWSYGTFGTFFLYLLPLIKSVVNLKTLS